MFQGMEQAIKKTSTDAEGTDVNQNQLMSLSAVRKFLLGGILHFKLIILIMNRTSFLLSDRNDLETYKICM